MTRSNPRAASSAAAPCLTIHAFGFAHSTGDERYIGERRYSDTTPSRLHPALSATLGTSDESAETFSGIRTPELAEQNKQWANELGQPRSALAGTGQQQNHGAGRGMRGDVVGADDPTFGKLGNRSSEGAIFLARYPPTACCRLKGRASERPLLFAGVTSENARLCRRLQPVLRCGQEDAVQMARLEGKEAGTRLEHQPGMPGRRLPVAWYAHIRRATTACGRRCNSGQPPPSGPAQMPVHDRSPVHPDDAFRNRRSVADDRV